MRKWEQRKDGTNRKQNSKMADLNPTVTVPTIGEGNGTPLQYSCLENPMNGGAWWAKVHGVAKSWT